MKPFGALPVLLFLLFPGIALAQTATTTTDTASITTATQPVDWFTTETVIGRPDVGDFVVGPGRTEVELVPGQTVVRNIIVTNRISDERTFKLDIVDMSGTSDGSAALEIIEGERGPYSVLDYVSFPENTVTLKLGERATLPMTISLPADAEPGGYYGSVLVSTIRANGESGNQLSSPIIARVGSHLFITVAGEELRSGTALDMVTLPTKLWYESGPITFNIAYENTGSVHLNPYGEISVTNLFGEQVGYVALEPWFVLPDSIRNREVVWEREFLFGRYTAEATINRGYDDITDVVAVTFWVLPWKVLLAIFASLFFLVFTVRFFVKNFEFKRRS